MIRSTVCVAIAISLSFVSTARAGIIYGSGYQVSPNLGGQRDSHWMIVAGPASFAPPNSQSYPYAAYVPKYIAPVFYGSIDGTYLWPLGELQNGYTDPNTGQISYWISPNNTDTTASITTGNYNWIAAQNFTIDQAGTYDFTFPVSGDNQIRFFINGTVDATNPEAPNIVGGNQIGSAWNDFQNIGNITGAVTLAAGQHTAYMVLYDFGGDTAALIGTASFANNAAAVPEPFSLGLLGVIAGGAACARRWKRRNAKRLASADLVF